MIALYRNDISVYGQKVRFTLVEKKLAWEGRHLKLRAGRSAEARISRARS